MSTAMIYDTQVWDLTNKPGVTVKSALGKDEMLATVMGTGSLTIKNIVFDGTLRKEDGSVDSNRKSLSALINVQDSGTLIMDMGSIVENNYTNNEGAGIRLIDNASLIMQGNASIRNTRSTTVGGGIMAAGTNSTVTIKDSASVTGNSAQTGAGIYMNGSMNLLGGNIADNTASFYGGGLFINTSAKAVVFTGGAISGNTAHGLTDPTTGRGNDIYSNGHKLWKLSGDWKTSDGIFLNKMANVLITSAVKNPIVFEGVRNTTGLEGTVVAVGSGGYSLTQKDLDQLSCKEMKIGFELDTINNLIKVKILSPYTVTFDKNGGSGDNFTQEVYPKHQVIKPENPTREGYVFRGWNNGITTFDFEKTIITENTTLKAQWHAHTYDTNWKFDATNHWHECTANDGEKSDMVAHTPGVAATIEHAQICIVCGYELVPKLPSKEIIVDNTTGTKVEYEDGSVFADDITLVVTPKSKEEMKEFQNNVNKVVTGKTIAGVYDIKLLKNGVEIQPDGKLKISLILTDAMKAMSELQVVYIDDNEELTIIPSQLIDGKLVFITDHFSYYGVIGKESR
ncbi:InlB B-repeat-containing protein [Amedibacillus sp. YH-ame6]